MSQETIQNYGAGKNTAIKEITVPSGADTTTPESIYAAPAATKKWILDRVICTLGREGTITLRSATSHRTLFKVGADGAHTPGDWDELGIHGDDGEGIEAVVEHYTATVADTVSVVIVQGHLEHV